MNASTCAAIQMLPERLALAECSPAGSTIRDMVVARVGGSAADRRRPGLAFEQFSTARERFELLFGYRSLWLGYPCSNSITVERPTLAFASLTCVQSNRPTLFRRDTCRRNQFRVRAGKLTVVLADGSALLKGSQSVRFGPIFGRRAKCVISAERRFIGSLGTNDIWHSDGPCIFKPLTHDAAPTIEGLTS